MPNVLVVLVYAARLAVAPIARRLRLDDRGEGVISTAIAVLIIAFLGALMWLGFKEIWLDARDNTATQIDEIGR